eukprot:CAMPEP_0113313004 /NCGR_PEP_ID=MMETSP0010_2-20120614/9600_1 /TAXON_ID=216773 ORGANISM="Corethron hystrix, Strain 308" /NCGR_SAMPLE_ID=MMETSP0010_2 /ASSEMBLY_ACC=CAM_ASM_000155 /LENGTH=309 /DNA_ID=CAMNT_0000168927 /DNA_START=125 /DNA_END=1051 /DNA_ORIENTATION=+ /assembly_acc=CAM_ASM_000155
MPSSIFKFVAALLITGTLDGVNSLAPFHPHVSKGALPYQTKNGRLAGRRRSFVVRHAGVNGNDSPEDTFVEDAVNAIHSIFGGMDGKKESSVATVTSEESVEEIVVAENAPSVSTVTSEESVEEIVVAETVPISETEAAVSNESVPLSESVPVPEPAANGIPQTSGDSNDSGSEDTDKNEAEEALSTTIDVISETSVNGGADSNDTIDVISETSVNGDADSNDTDKNDDESEPVSETEIPENEESEPVSEVAESLPEKSTEITENNEARNKLDVALIGPRLIMKFFTVLLIKFLVDAVVYPTLWFYRLW